jgi:Flp pilus assembly protein TadD
VQRIVLGLLLLLVTSCADNGVPSLRTGAPGVEVAQAALRGGSPRIALQVVDNILAKDPTNEPALIIQGEALTGLGQLDEASASFEKVLQRNATSIAAHIGLGRLRLASDPAGAEALLLEALARDPRNGVALNDLGIARDLQGRHTDAQTAYRQALATSPEMSAARVNLALSLAMDGQGRDAIQLLRPLATGPGASRQVRHDLAAVLVMGGEKAEAASILGKDLSPAEVQQALDAYAAAKSTDAVKLLRPADPPPPSTAPAADPAPAASGCKSSSVPARSPDQSHADERSGTIQVQLAASDSESAAQAQWTRLQQRLPDAFAERQPAVTRVERDGHVFWRLRTGGFADATQAGAFCSSLHAAGAGCVLAR